MSAAQRDSSFSGTFLVPNDDELRGNEGLNNWMVDELEKVWNLLTDRWRFELRALAQAWRLLQIYEHFIVQENAFETAMDVFVLSKILPRLEGSRHDLKVVLESLRTM
jgi:hypothetical protein